VNYKVISETTSKASALYLQELPGYQNVMESYEGAQKDFNKQ